MAAGSPARRPGLPPTRPRLRAARRPALVRSAISARSSWATAPSTCSENMPCGVVVSIGSRRVRKCALGLELFDDVEQVANRAGEALQPHDDQGFAGTDLTHEACQYRARAIGAGGVFLEDCLAA